MSSSGTEEVKSGCGFLKWLLTTVLCAGLFGVVFSAAGMAQTPGYGEKPDQWAPYEGGRYFDHLQKIASTYEISGWKIAYLHFDANDSTIGDVDLFRISGGADCHGKDDCYFVLFSSEMPNTPLVTACQFRWGQTATIPIVRISGASNSNARTLFCK